MFTKHQNKVPKKLKVGLRLWLSQYNPVSYGQSPGFTLQQCLNQERWHTSKNPSFWKAQAEGSGVKEHPGLR